MKTQQIVFALASALVLLPAAFAPAAVKTWNSGSGDWSVPGNWTLAGVPALGDVVNIVNTDGAARTVALDVSTPSLGLMSLDLTGPGIAANTLSITSNHSITAAALSVGGYNGTAFTNGRGGVNQSAGTTTISPGVDLIMAWGSGSRGTYMLSGGAIVANQGVWVGYAGTGTFNHSAGTHTVNASAFGGYWVGANAGAVGTYNLSGSGNLSVSANEYVGYSGIGIVNQTGGTNTVTGAGGLTLGWAAGGNGTYTISGGALTATNKIEVGRLGTGTMTIQNNGSVSTNSLSINNLSTVNLNGGTLRFNGYSRAPGGIVNHTAGTIQLAGARTFGSDTAIADLFGSAPRITSGRALTIEGNATVNVSTTLSGGTLSVWNAMTMGTPQGIDFTLNSGSAATANSLTLSVDRTEHANAVISGGVLSVTNTLVVAETGDATLQISGGGRVESTTAEVGKYASQYGCGIGQTCYDQASGNVTVTGLGSTWEISGGLTLGGPNGIFSGYGNLNVADSALVSVGGELRNNSGSVSLNGGTLRLNSWTGTGSFTFNSGTIQLGGDRNVGADTLVTKFIGATPTIVTGKNLTIEETATLSTRLKIDGGTFKAKALNFNAGSELDFYRGTLEVAGGPILGLPNLVIPAYGEFRAAGVQSLRVMGTTGSTITATGNLTLGNATAVNGFATQGTFNVGANSVVLLDANDVVFDSLALAALGNGSSAGTLTAANGLTLDFGGNITGFGTVSTPNLLAKPLINNGHITGNSPAQRITLPGYVKGVGTFDNVNIAGTFSPGLSPTILSVGNVVFSPTSTLIMELGGTAPGSGYDQIHSSGTLTFDGTLQISLINGFSPTPGQSFNLFDSITTSGAFDTLELPSLAGWTWNTSQLATGMLSVAIPGDFNNNGTVDAADFIVWRKNVGGLYTQNDYNTWRANFGQPPGSGAVTITNGVVPEPATLPLLIMGAAAFSLRSCRIA